MHQKINPSLTLCPPPLRTPLGGVDQLGKFLGAGAYARGAQGHVPPLRVKLGLIFWCITFL